eukprot:TRINITY_DN7229_c0_g1_i1.p1 TRINITY_DN7229_c0_g1~~TRINITY_DN7229_c0_g1_i1.p1  ORF type:complete len:255 (-),score=39.45 TRINITY_DN7229_c0_g1_i1:115-879(-)
MGGNISLPPNPYTITPVDLKEEPVPSTRIQKDPNQKTLKIVCISDTHRKHREMHVPDGDILVHTGDFGDYFTTSMQRDIIEFNNWLGTLPHKHKLVVAGNHDLVLNPDDVERSRKLLSNCTYLQDETVEVEGIKIHGCPWQPTRLWIKRSNAFSIDPPELRKKLDLIPEDVDILLTHCPAITILDDYFGRKGGSEDILNYVISKKPKMYVFGHIHFAPGVNRGTLEEDGKTRSTLFVNAAAALTKQAIPIEYVL